MRFLYICGSSIVLISSIFASMLYGQESLFPDIPGWKLVQDEPVYDSNNLWDVIDGAADLYLEYAFIDLHIARYISVDSIEIKSELYRHSSEADAFGIYSQERDPNYNFIDMGVQGYLQAGILNYLDGIFYIKLSTYQAGNTAQEALRSIAEHIRRHLKQNSSWPKMLQFFPGLEKLPNTERYIARNFLGYSFLNSVYVVDYMDSTVLKVFIIETEAPEKAETIISEYLNVTPKEAIRKLDEKTYEIRNTHYGFLAIAVQKNILYGLMNYANDRTREIYLHRLSACLSK